MAYVSSCIAATTVCNAINALAYSDRVSPLRAWVSIKKQLPPFPTESEHRSIIQKLMKRFSRWCRVHGIPCAYIYCFENPRSERRHFHALMHVPSRLYRELRLRFAKWLGASDRDIVWGNSRTSACRTQSQRIGCLKYMLKGMDHAVCVNLGGRRTRLSQLLGVDDRGKGSQGRIQGKRIGLSHSLTRAERKRGGFVELRSPLELAQFLNPFGHGQELA